MEILSAELRMSSAYMSVKGWPLFARALSINVTRFCICSRDVGSCTGAKFGFRKVESNGVSTGTGQGKQSVFISAAITPTKYNRARFWGFHSLLSA